MVVTNEDRYAVLEEKLKQAESALYGCRAMIDYCRRMEAEERGSAKFRDADGLFPGQIRPKAPDCGEQVEDECIE